MAIWPYSALASNLQRTAQGTMKMQLLQKILTISLCLPLVATAQGTFVFDQQSSDESNPGSGFNIIQNSQPVGQSFTPALDAIGFVRFNLFDQVRSNGTGAVVYVNLRSGSITGPIIDSTAPVTLPDNFGPDGFVNFLFASNVPLQSGVKYYLQPVVQSGDPWGIIGGTFNYPGGDLYANGTAFSSDLWFREGTIVPEPSAPLLLFFAVGICVLCRRLKTF
jgi:hypothetical protein